MELNYILVTNGLGNWEPINSTNKVFGDNVQVNCFNKKKPIQVFKWSFLGLGYLTSKNLINNSQNATL
jgi:hypothetical protein